MNINQNGYNKEKKLNIDQYHYLILKREKNILLKINRASKSYETSKDIT